MLELEEAWSFVKRKAGRRLQGMPELLGLLEGLQQVFLEETPRQVDKRQRHVRQALSCSKSERMHHLVTKGFTAEYDRERSLRL